MKTSQIFSLKKSILIVPLVLITGCSYKPVAIHEGDLYVGAFRSGGDKELGCDYSYIEGGGVKLGVINFGLGYFNNKIMKVEKGVAKSCKSEIGEAFVVDDKVSEKDITFE